MSLLHLQNVYGYYQQINAISDISIQVKKGEIVTLIGSNGAGKTTTLKAICRQIKTTGTIFFNNTDITSYPSHLIAKTGIAHVPEGRHIFPKLTVEENLQLGSFQLNDKKLKQEQLDKVFSYFPRIKERLRQQGGTLSGGEQQMLAIGRSLMMNPKILLLDEPSMGLAPVIVDKIMEIIVELNKNGMTILLVEQNAYQALQIAHRAYVLQTGRIIMEDNANNLLKNEQILDAYLT